MRTARDTYRRWRQKGMSEAEAGNLCAYAVGLTPVAAGWTPAEIERLLFVAWLTRTGRIRSGPRWQTLARRNRG